MYLKQETAAGESCVQPTTSFYADLLFIVYYILCIESFEIYIFSRVVMDELIISVV